ncbi:butyrate kinase [Clostridium polynesiense]|uniref:butyrate kinase n=1 Tax=Clostridium polynesiense TaxID=1325933 RepID=UPI000591828B|nr:butyrate kinase [Clostridium polynesiense]
MVNKNLILVINPGSTSTKIAIYQDEKFLEAENLSHSNEEISGFSCIYDQQDMRTNVILNWIEEKGISLKAFCAVVGRGGLLRPMPGGTYLVTEAMLKDLRTGFQGQHASNLGGIISYNIANSLNIPAYIVDPVAVDEIHEEARISGMPEIPRRSLVHALNIKATSRKICDKINKVIEDTSFIVAHLGGGISVVPLKNGKIIDVNNANEEGPFSPERAGGLPAGDLVRLCFSGRYSYSDIKKKMVGNGGLIGYLGTNDGRVVKKRIQAEDSGAELIYKALAYQISKEIGAMAAVLHGKVDRIILTGGLAYDSLLTSWIKERVEFIAPIEVVPGENEMESLAQGALRVLKQKEKAKIYENEVFIDG